MLTLPPEDHAYGSCEKCLENSYWAELNRWRCLFLAAEQGQVAILFALVIFLGMSFVGIALDYGRYVAGKEKIRSFMDQTATRGAGTCRRYFLTEINKPGANFNNALQEGINYARDESARHMQQQVSRTFRGTGLWIDEYTNVAYDVRPLLKPNGPSPNQDYCSVAITYNGRVATTFSGLFGVKEWKVPGRVVALGALNDNVTTNLEIDFLVDVSSSMSTIANPQDRDLMMALTTSGENVEPAIPNGCIFVCHLRNALLPGPMSRRIISFAKGSASSATEPVKYHTTYSYNGGTSTATLNKGRGTLRTFKNKSPYSSCNTTGSGTGICTSHDEELVMLDDALKYFNIRLKSDEVFDNVKLLVTSLMGTTGVNTSGAGNIKLAFHRFSNQYRTGSSNRVVKTFLPYTANMDSNGLIPLGAFQLTQLKFSDFDYAVPNIMGDLEIARIFPSDTNGDYAVYARTDGGSSPNSVTLGVLPDALKGSVLPDRSRPSTHFPQAVSEITDKIRSRPPVPNDTTRAVVLVTDGIQNLGTTGIQTAGSVGLANPANCNALKDDKVIILVVHSYYRFQPGHNASRNLYTLAGGSTSMMRANIDQEEKHANESRIKNALADCASSNPEPEPGQDPKYYFPASDANELKASFEALLNSLVSVGKSETPVLLIN